MDAWYQKLNYNSDSYNVQNGKMASLLNPNSFIVQLQIWKYYIFSFIFELFASLFNFDSHFLTKMELLQQRMKLNVINSRETNFGFSWQISIYNMEMSKVGIQFTFFSKFIFTTLIMGSLFHTLHNFVTRNEIVFFLLQLKFI